MILGTRVLTSIIDRFQLVPLAAMSVDCDLRLLFIPMPWYLPERAGTIISLTPFVLRNIKGWIRNKRNSGEDSYSVSAP